MAILCAGDCHVYSVGAAYCTCGAQINTPPQHLMGYLGFGQPAPPKPAQPANEIPLAALKAAQAVNATHLSADGKIAYQVRYGKVRWAEWLGNEFGSFFPLDKELPEGAVEI